MKVSSLSGSEISSRVICGGFLEDAAGKAGRRVNMSLGRSQKLCFNYISGKAFPEDKIINIYIINIMKY